MGICIEHTTDVAYVNTTRENICLNYETYEYIFSEHVDNYYNVCLSYT